VKIRRLAFVPALALVVGMVAGPSIANGASAPDFTIAASPTSATVVAGGTASTKVSTTPLGGLVGDVAFTATGLPAVTSATFTPVQTAIGSGTSLSVATDATTPAGTYAITITGTQVLNVITVAPIVRSTTFQLQVTGSTPAAPAPGITAAFNAAYGKAIRGVWTQPPPAACPRVNLACSLDYSNLRLPPFEQHVVIRQYPPKPDLSYEVFHFDVPAGQAKCQADDSADWTGLTGTADGPFPGTVEIIGGGVGPRVDPPASRWISFFYQINSPFLTNLSVGTGMIQGSFLGACFIGIGHDEYDAEYATAGWPGVFEMGSGLVLVRGAAGVSKTIDIALTSYAGLPDAGSLQPPTPVCPPAGCS
jgi:hypothetical protein